MAVVTAGDADWCLTPGPDIVVRDIFDCLSYGSVGDRAAFSLGTDACNIGDEVVNWFGETEDHPVIASAAYRLHEGRLEQIGMSWLKHGFGAAQEDTCGCDCTPADWTHLGVGCSDAYNAGTNGIQSIAGSRLEVNPWTGEFPFPPSGWGQSGDVIFRRLQMDHEDLDPAFHPGAQYFVETNYVLPHDASFGNQRNNYSTRPVSYVSSGASWSMSLQGETLAREPALRMWQALDPEVVLVEVEMPGEGRVMVGCRVHAEAEGWYRYEYAVQNLDNALGVRSIRIPHSQWASIESLRFHDVEYHSGDPVIGTDWAVVMADETLAWSTDSWSQDPMANAIRWGTTYSFGFRTNVEPVEGLLELEFFAPGDEPGVTVGLPVPRTEGVDPCLLPPGSCPLDVDGDLVVGVNDLLMVLAHYAECGDGTWQPPGDIDMDCCVTVNDVLVLIGSWGLDCTPRGACCYGASGCAEDYSEPECDAAGGDWLGEDSTCASCVSGACCATDGSCTQETPDDCSAAGNSYQGHNTACSEVICLAAPDNNSCDGAIAIHDGDTGIDNNAATTTGDVIADCGGVELQIYNDLYYSYTASCTGLVTISTCNQVDFDTIVAVHDSCGGTLLTCNDDGADCSGFSSIVEVNMTMGDQVIIRIGSYAGGNTGTGVVTIACELPMEGGCCLSDGSCVEDLLPGECADLGGIHLPDGVDCTECPLMADACVDADVVTEGEHAFDTRQATTDGPIHPECDTSDGGYTGNDIWMRYTSTGTGTLTLSTCSTADYDSDMVIYDGIDCENLVLLGCNDDTEGCVGFTSYLEVPVQDGGMYLIRLGGWQETHVGTGTLSITLASSVFGACCLEDGTCLDGLEEIPCNDSGGAWGGADSSCADFLCAPINDDCANATLIEDGAHLFDTRQATTDGPIHAECETSDGGVTGNDIWFRYTAEFDGILELSTCSSADYDTDLLVYDGVDCEALVLLGCNDDTEGCEGWTSFLQVSVIMGGEYLLRVGGWQEGSVGTGLLSIELSWE